MPGLAGSRPAFRFSAPFRLRHLLPGAAFGRSIRLIGGRGDFTLLLLLHVAATHGRRRLFHVASAGSALRVAAFLLVWALARRVAVPNGSLFERGLALALGSLGFGDRRFRLGR